MAAVCLGCPSSQVLRVAWKTHSTLASRPLYMSNGMRLTPSLFLTLKFTLAMPGMLCCQSDVESVVTYAKVQGTAGNSVPQACRGPTQAPDDAIWSSTSCMRLSRSSLKHSSDRNSRVQPSWHGHLQIRKLFTYLALRCENHPGFAPPWNPYTEITLRIKRDVVRPRPVSQNILISAMPLV